MPTANSSPTLPASPTSLSSMGEASLALPLLLHQIDNSPEGKKRLKHRPLSRIIGIESWPGRERQNPPAPQATPRIALKCQHTIFATASQRGKTTVFENPGPLIFLMPVLRASSDAGPSRADTHPRPCPRGCEGTTAGGVVFGEDVTPNFSHAWFGRPPSPLPLAAPQRRRRRRRKGGLRCPRKISSPFGSMEAWRCSEGGA